MRRFHTLTLLTAIVAVAASTPLWTGPPAEAAETSDVSVAAVAPRRIIGVDFPDPDVSNFGGTYYAYATNTGGKNLPVARATAPEGTWSILGADALPTLGAWAKPGWTWAPEVTKLGNNYVLYYTARHATAVPDRQCIGVATSTSPTGPFTPVGSGPLVCPLSEGGAIDASTFSEGGRSYLLYKTDANAIGRPPVVYLQETTADGLTLVGSRVALMRQDRPEERGILEAPVLIKQGTHYVLFYSAGEYWNDSYFTSYGISTSLTGTYQKAFRPLMTGASLDGSVVGPGGADILRGGQDKIVFHGDIDPGSGLTRGVYIADLGWANDYPVVRGSRVRVETEGGRLNHCQVRSGAAGASQGAVVAYIDYADSWVEVSVFAASAGTHTIAVGYANGTTAVSRHTLSVNGGSLVQVQYPPTGWDNWQQVNVDVSLAKGWNVLRFTHSSSFAELDYIEYR